MLANFPVPQDELPSGSSGWWKTLTDCLPVLAGCAGPNGQCIYFNERWLQFTGRTLESLGDGWAGDVHPDDRDRVFLDYHYSLQRRQKFRLEYRLRYQNGPYRWIVDFGAPVFDQHRTFLGYVGGCIDVTLVKGSGLATPWPEAFEAVLNADVNELVEKLGAAEIAIQDRLNDQPSDLTRSRLLATRPCHLAGYQENQTPFGIGSDDPITQGLNHPISFRNLQSDLCNLQSTISTSLRPWRFPSRPLQFKIYLHTLPHPSCSLCDLCGEAFHCALCG